MVTTRNPGLTKLKFLSKVKALRKIKVLLQQEDHDGVNHAYLLLIKRDPSDYELQYKYAMFLIHSFNDVENAEQWLLRVVNWKASGITRPSDFHLARTYNALAIIADNDHDIHKAFIYACQAVGAHEDYAAGWSTLAKCYLAKNNQKKADLCYKKARELDQKRIDRHAPLLVETHLITHSASAKMEISAEASVSEVKLSSSKAVWLHHRGGDVAVVAVKPRVKSREVKEIDNLTSISNLIKYSHPKLYVKILQRQTEPKPKFHQVKRKKVKAQHSAKQPKLTTQQQLQLQLKKQERDRLQDQIQQKKQLEQQVLREQKKQQAQKIKQVEQQCSQLAQEWLSAHISAEESRKKLTIAVEESVEIMRKRRQEHEQQLRLDQLQQELKKLQQEVEQDLLQLEKQFSSPPSIQPAISASNSTLLSSSASSSSSVAFFTHTPAPPSTTVATSSAPTFVPRAS